MTDLRLDHIRLVKNTFGCSVNDVVMAVIAGAMRRWLLHDGGITTDPELVPNPQEICDWALEELALLVDAATPRSG